MAAMCTIIRSATYLAVIFLSVFSSVLCSERLIVTQAPEYLHFTASGSPIRLSEIPSVVSTTFGYSLKNDLLWSGLTHESLFRRPKANVLISIEGFKDESLDLNLHHVSKYPVESDEPFINTELVGNKLQSSQKNPLVVDFSTDNTVFNIKSQHPKLFSGLSSTLEKVRDVLESHDSPLASMYMGSLNTSEQTDVMLLGELHLIHEVIQALKNNPESVEDLSPDMFHFRLGGLKGLVEAYGSKSGKVHDAVGLLRTFLTKVTEDFRTLYNNNVVVEIVTMSGVVKPLSRKTRRLLQATEAKSLKETLSVQNDYVEDYEVIFNIILWTMLVLVLVIIGISTGIWNMDPGRDSIIYRMTSQRIKKD